MCLKGLSIFVGYLNVFEKIVEIIDKDGWFYIGDIGEWFLVNLCLMFFFFLLFLYKDF